MGGALAQRWALRRPERVAALVLSSSFARVGGGSWRRRYLEQPLVLAGQRLLPDAWAAAWSRALAARGAWVYDPRCDEPVLALVRHAIRRLPPALAAARVRQAFAHDTRAALGELRCPTLVVVGERETAWARSASEDLAARIHGAELRVSPGVGHLHPLSASQWLTEAIGDFLGRLGDWAAG
jgi:pimeloyl-ACP methyl ester carboxylesterase